LIFFFVLGLMAPILTMNHLRIHVPQATAAAETVRVITTPVFPHIPRLQASKDFQVLVRIEAPPAAQPHRRVPVDIAVVLDVGGSTGTGTGTGTGTTRLDAVKKAVKFIIRQIHDDDRLAVVGPSNYRLVTGFLNTHDARRNVEKSVDQLEPRGEFTSGSGAGLEEAIKVPAERATFRHFQFTTAVLTTGISDPGEATDVGKPEQPRALRHLGDGHGSGRERQQIHQQAAARLHAPSAHVRARRGPRPQGAVLHRQ
jgi:hypothetical protein